jgi:hypothetical protein
MGGNRDGKEAGNRLPADSEANSAGPPGVRGREGTRAEFAKLLDNAVVRDDSPGTINEPLIKRPLLATAKLVEFQKLLPIRQGHGDFK